MTDGQPFVAFSSVELRSIAEFVEMSNGNYAQIIDHAPGEYTVLETDAESGGVQFTVDDQGNVVSDGMAYAMRTFEIELPFGRKAERHALVET